MKITPNHYEQLITGIRSSKNKFPSFGYFKTIALKETSRNIDSIAMCYRWELFYEAFCSTSFIGDLYDYMNDAHIDTALRHAMKEIEQ